MMPSDDSEDKKAESGDNLSPRRRFLSLLISGSFVAVIVAALYPVIKFLIPPRVAEPVTNSIDAAKVGELRDNSGKVFRFGNEPAILIKTPEGELRAFTAVCTHLGCTVQYRSDL